MQLCLLKTSTFRGSLKTTTAIHNAWCLPLRGSRSCSTKVSQPLRILFCGSDEFSIASLTALHEEHLRNPSLIRSIDVFCRPGKRAGRSLRTVREVPVKAVARELGLRIHERDTFKGWELPTPGDEAINLIIAVSFGLFIPPRLLKAAEYGGLNVHPSLLPQFRGPAPIQHTIINGCTKTGVTLQTLDEKSFDHGMILAQTPGDGVLIPQDLKCTYPILLNLVSALGASMLVDGLRDQVHVPPLRPVDRRLSKMQQQDGLIHATKITTIDRHMPFGLNAARFATRLEQALGRLWCNVWVATGRQKRLSFEELEVVVLPSIMQQKIGSVDVQHDDADVSVDSPAVYFMVVSRHDGRRQVVLYIEEGSSVIFILAKECLKIHFITIEGEAKTTAVKAMRSIRGRRTWNLRSDGNLTPASSLGKDSHGCPIEAL